MGNSNRDIHKVVEDAVVSNQAHASAPPAERNAPSPVPSSSRTMNMQSATTFAHRNTTVPPDSAPAVSSTNRQTQTSALSPQASLNIPALTWPVNSRLVPNVVGNKETAAMSRYRADSNALRLEHMFVANQTAIASTREHISNVRDIQQNTDVHFRDVTAVLTTENRHLREDVGMLQQEMQKIGSLQSSMEPANVFVDSSKRQSSAAATDNDSMIDNIYATRSPSPASSDSAQLTRSPTTDILSPVARTPSRSPARSPPPYNASPSMLTGQESIPRERSPSVIPLLDRLSNAPMSQGIDPATGTERMSPSSGPPAKVRKTRDHQNVHSAIPGSTVHVQSSGPRFANDINRVRAFFHTWYLQLDSSSSQRLPFPYHLAHVGPAQLQMRLTFNQPSHAAAFVNAWNVHHSSISSSRSYTVTLEPGSS